MAILSSEFSDLLWSYDVEDLDKYASAVYGLSVDWRLCYFNVLSAAWPKAASGATNTNVRAPMSIDVSI